MKFLWAGVLMVLMGIAYFFRKKRKIDQKHQAKIQELKKKYELHSKQLAYRKQHLNRYDFLTYNLKEVLVVQPEIKQL